MREFWLENSIGEKMSLNNSEQFLTLPNGLGIDNAIEMASLGDGFGVIQSNTALPNEIFADINFKPPNAYEKHRVFIDWLYKSEGIVIAYKPDSTRVLLSNIIFERIEKSELTTGGVLECPVVIRCLTPFYNRNPKNFIFTNSEGGKIYGYRYNYKYGTDGRGEITVSPQGHYPAGFKFVAYGSFNNPKFEVYDTATGDLIGALILDDLQVNDGEILTYSNIKGATEVYITSNGIKRDVSNYIDTSYAVYFGLNQNKTHTIRFTADNTAEQTHMLYVYEYFRG